MFYSMTGYGTGQAISKKMEVLCEIKSVNNRFVDISFRGYSLPNDFEEYIKIQLKKKFLRGSFEVKIHDNFQSEHSYELNQESIRNLKSTLKASKDFKNLNLKLSDLRDIPGLLTVRSSKKDISPLGKKALNIAIKNLVESRAKEGQKIEKIIIAKTLFLKNAHQKLSRSAPSLLKHRVKTIKNKFIQKYIDINKDEIANELSNVALKHDIAEELERISFHIESLNKLFKLKNAHGKKMDFILQELFREVNTLSVKIEKPDLKDLALTMKLKVEELREQAQNLE
ncbi:TIGR00255 family protein [SAR86 cluster bacterium SAR86E]|jgi:uncharacterized protein (TIGR00255 family)|uniref:TIGR00255 family protein n=1 Tax=SAR86 cluster bacterium SAR86E TaxID=1208365 RepID=K6H126_9GAMM|nr:TIGR00255 family protein [SAR86 cluster bacterium SAR86E]